MPEKKTVQRARRAERQGKSASTQAGEFVREGVKVSKKSTHTRRSTEKTAQRGAAKRTAHRLTRKSA